MVGDFVSLRLCIVGGRVRSVLSLTRLQSFVCVMERHSLFQRDLPTHSTFHFPLLPYTFSSYYVLTARECSGNTPSSCPFNAQQRRKPRSISTLSLLVLPTRSADPIHQSMCQPLVLHSGLLSHSNPPKSIESGPIDSTTAHLGAPAQE